MKLRYILTTLIFCSLNTAFATTQSVAPANSAKSIQKKKTNSLSKKAKAKSAAGLTQSVAESPAKPTIATKKLKFAKTKAEAINAKKLRQNKTTKVNSVNSSTTSSAITQINQVTAQAEPKKEAKLVDFGLGISSGYNTQAENQPDGSRAEYISHEIVPSMRFSDYSLSGVFTYNDDIKDPSANEWQDSTIALGRKAWSLGEYFKLGPTLVVGLPMAKATREDIKLKYVLAGALGLSLNTKALGADNLSLSYGLSYTKMYTEFETKANGEPLSSYRIRQTVSVGYKITSALSFMTQLRFDSSYSYANVVRNSFVAFQALEYKFTENISMNIAHANGGQAFLVKEGDKDYYLENNVKIYDPKTSEYSIGIGLSI